MGHYASPKLRWQYLDTDHGHILQLPGAQRILTIAKSFSFGSDASLVTATNLPAGGRRKTDAGEESNTKEYANVSRLNMCNSRLRKYDLVTFMSGHSLNPFAR